MQLLKQSAAWTAIIGPILDSAGAEYTGAVIGDLSISKNGTEAAMAAAATLTHVSNGFYTLVGTTGNFDTLGAVTIRCNKSTYQMPPKEYTVLAAAAFDVLVTNGNLASTTNITAGTITTVTNLTNLPSIPANWLTAAGLAADAIAEIQLAITGGAYDLDTDANGRIRHVVGTGAGEHETLSGTVLLRAATQASIDAIETDINTIQSDLFGTADVPALVSAIFQDTTAGDFTVAGSIGKSIMNGVALGTGLTINAYTGNTVQTGDGYAVVNSGTFGNSALNTDLDSLLTRLTATRAGYLDNLSAGAVATAAALDAVDNFLDTEIGAIITTLGTPAGASVSADLVVIDDFVDALETRLTAARAGYLDNINVTFPSNFASLGINVSGHVSRVTLADTVTTNTDMITAADIRTALGMATNNLDTQLGAIDDLLDTEIAAIQTTLAALFTTALTESYRTDGATGTVAQLLYEILSHHAEVAISGTTKTTKKIDGSTTATTLTLNSATTPTAVTRAA